MKYFPRQDEKLHEILDFMQELGHENLSASTSYDNACVDLNAKFSNNDCSLEVMIEDFEIESNALVLEALRHFGNKDVSIVGYHISKRHPFGKKEFSISVRHSLPLTAKISYCLNNEKKEAVFRKALKALGVQFDYSKEELYLFPHLNYKERYAAAFDLLKEKDEESILQLESRLRDATIVITGRSLKDGYGHLVFVLISSAKKAISKLDSFFKSFYPKSSGWTIKRY